MNPRAFLLLLALVSLSANAQLTRDERLDSLIGQHKRLFRIDSLLKLMFYAKQFDTAYISRPSERWTVKARANISGRMSRSEGVLEGQSVRLRRTSQGKLTFSTSVGYRGISLGLSINPASFSGKDRDMELNLVSYGNKLGFEIAYEDSKRAKTEMETGGSTYDISDLGISSRMLNLTAYYALNHRRFSFPAAFSQSYIQRRSCGSVLFGVSYVGGHTRADASAAYQTPSMELRTSNFGLGAGYGYNYVPHRKWLVHLSLLPTVIVFKSDRMERDGEVVEVARHFPDVDVALRAAVAYRFENYFYGATFAGNTSRLGSDGQMVSVSTKWRLRLVFGVRL